MRFLRILAAYGMWKVEQKMDKDRFRRDLGGVEDAYIQVAKRLGLEMESK